MVRGSELVKAKDFSFVGRFRFGLPAVKVFVKTDDDDVVVVVFVVGGCEVIAVVVVVVSSFVSDRSDCSSDSEPVVLVLLVRLLLDWLWPLVQPSFEA